MNTAIEIMTKYAQPHLPCGLSGEIAILFLDIADSDGRWYRIEFQSSFDASHAVAIVRFNPWATDRKDMTAGEHYEICHVDKSGVICMGAGHRGAAVEDNPFELEWVLQRATLWVNCFSFLKEHGRFPDDEELS